ncbi:MAG TPA: hypothetical protein VJI75_03700 [Candidatus Nanoarchaeia archaeon]|nr:hypothetical protein [Candidatus Nanoarchaeia archaeon]
MNPKKDLRRYSRALVILALGVILSSIQEIKAVGWMFLLIGILLFSPEIMALIRWTVLQIKLKYLRNKLPDTIQQILKEIDSFTPSKNWHSEEGYQGELQGHLKHKFPTSRVEVQVGASRPDIVIDNVAIEIKGPTDDNAINSLPAKCIKYTKQYDYLIIVLFNPSFSKRNYHEIMSGIKKLHSHVEILIK